MSAARKLQNQLPLDQTLVGNQLITPNDLRRAKELQATEGGSLPTCLIKIQAINEEMLYQFLSKTYNCPFLKLNTLDIPSDVISTLTPTHCRKFTVIPTSKLSNRLVIAVTDPTDLSTVETLSEFTKCQVDVAVAPERSIITAINKYYSAATSEPSEEELKKKRQERMQRRASYQNEDDAESLLEIENQATGPAVQFVNKVLSEAIRNGASDIHVEPFEDFLRVRYRIDGTLMENTNLKPPPETERAIVSRLKILSGMNISEKRRPQDGRLRVKKKGEDYIDFRLSSIPTMFGESVVMRLLDKSNLNAELGSLGFAPAQLEAFNQTIAQPQGMILVTGPTGSGKTTTLFSAIKELNQPSRKILTAEDPIEFNLEGITQTQMQSEIDYTFADALRAFLRQDPDVILVGEIRDLETAEIAYKAAATGHLVLSTLHTNDATATIGRLLDMGLPSYVVADSTSLIVAQRLIKKVCNHCKEEDPVPPQDLLKLGVKKEELGEYTTIYKGTGCDRCYGTGLSGRAPIFEVLQVGTLVRQAILEGCSALQLKKLVIAKGAMITLRQSALAYLKRGETTVSQVIETSLADDF